MVAVLIHLVYVFFIKKITYLDYELRKEHAEIIRLLLEVGADILRWDKQFVQLQIIIIGPIAILHAGK
jgi:hypothetical protein